MMKPKLDTWTIVIVGAWNVHVFSPEWVGKQLLDGKPMTIEVPVGPSGVKVRYSAEGLNLVPSGDRLIVGVQKADEHLIERAETAARNVLRLLPHTPVTAFGVNFGFHHAEPSDQLLGLFKLNDLDALSAFGCTIKRSNVVRSLEIAGAVVNGTHSLDSDGHAETDLNFHHDVPSADFAEKQLEGRARKCLDLARKLLTSVYNCNLEEPDDQGA
jgi:hypothetical protein